jgi:hypothetical protein
MYGLYIRDAATSDLIWFKTDKSLAPGAYTLSRHKSSPADVYIAESIPALLLQVGPLIEQVEKEVQSSLSTPDIPANTKRRIADQMTKGLLQRLTETSSIWVANPGWVNKLQPVAEASG